MTDKTESKTTSPETQKTRPKAKAKKAPAQKAAPKAKAKKTGKPTGSKTKKTTKGGRQTVTKADGIEASAPLKVLVENPHREGTARWDKFEHAKKAKTVQAYLDAGFPRKYLRVAVEAGWIKVG